MVKAQNCSLEVSEFELQSYYYVHFPKKTLGKGMNSLKPNYGLNKWVELLLFYKNVFGINNPQSLICH